MCGARKRTLVGPFATLTGYVGKRLLKRFQKGFDEQHIHSYRSVQTHARAEV